MLHQILIIQPTHGPHHRSQHNKENPFIMFEIDPFLFSRPTQHKEGENRQHHPDPLIEIQPFAKYQHRSHEHHHRTGGINRSHNGYRKILHAEIPQYPGRKDNDRFQNDISMHLPPCHGNKKKSAFQCIGTPCRQHNEGKEYQTGKQRIQREHGNYRIVL